MPTKEALEAWFRSQYESWLEDPKTPPEKRVSTATFDDVRHELKTFWASGSDRVRTMRTLEGYRQTLGFVLEYWGSDRIAELTPSAIDAYVAALRARGLSTSSIRHRLDMLSHLVKITVRRGYLSAPPCQINRPPLIQRTEPHGFSELETEQLIAGAKQTNDPRVLAAVLLAADAGLRREEMVRLHGDEVSLTLTEDAWGTITVATRSEAVRTKSGHGRVVPILTERLAAALKALFPATGKPLLRARTTVSVHSLAERAWLAAGYPKNQAQLHRLRHRFASWLADSGATLTTIRDLMGHRTVLTTERYLRRRSTLVPPALRRTSGANSAPAPPRDTGAHDAPRG